MMIKVLVASVVLALVVAPPLLVLGQTTSSIAQVVQSTADFSILAELLNQTGLSSVLECTTSVCTDYTLFAPINTAFGSLSPALETFLSNNEYSTHLSETMRYHVLRGRVLFNDFVDGGTVRTIQQGQGIVTSLNTTTTTTTLVLNNDATVFLADAVASNGIVHGIDRVLLPPSLQSNLIEIATAVGGFTTLLQALDAASLTETLQGPGPFTLFAPTNNAFDNLPDGIASLEGLLNDVPTLTAVLTYHVVPNRIVVSQQLTEGLDIVTLQGEELSVSYNGYWFYRFPVLNHDVQLIGFDLLASNGVLHVIDQVLLPDTLEQARPTLPVLLEGAPKYALFFSALSSTGLLSELLQDPNRSWTVFAPTDRAFGRLDPNMLNTILSDPAQLRRVLLYHMVEGNAILYEDFVNGNLTSVLGPALSVRIGPSRRVVFLNNNIRVNSLDELGSNGVIHPVTRVILPPPEEEGEGTMPSLAPTPAAVQSTIYQLATATDELSLLVTAIDVAGLVPTLNGASPLTLFAPTNQAFNALGNETLSSLLSDTATLTDVLLYHVVSGTVLSTDLMPGLVSTVQGENLTVSMFNGTLVLNGDVGLDSVDNAASNGVIHVIDQVLIPPSMVVEEPGNTPGSPGLPETTAPGLTPAPPLPTILELSVASPDFQTLVSVVEAANLTEALSGSGPLTLFAPTDQAFAELGDEMLASLLEDTATLNDILRYHVVSGAVLSSNLMPGQVTTLQGEAISVSRINGTFVLNSDVALLNVDAMASNGVVHVIDEVLIPPSLEVVQVGPSEPNGTAMTNRSMAGLNLLELGEASEDFTVLVAAVEAANLTGALTGPGPLTLFAPTDAGFNDLGEDILATLLNDTETLTEILRYHVVSGLVLSSSLGDGGESLTTLQGESIAVSTTMVEGGGRDFLLNGDVQVLDADVVGSNGVIHVIDGVLIPPSLSASVGNETAEPTLNNIYQLGLASDDFQTLTTAVEAANLTDALSSTGPLTLFAPNDQAFDRLGSDVVASLLNDTAVLTQVLLYHVLDGTVLSTDLVPGSVVTTLQGENITVTMSSNGTLVLNDGIGFVETDSAATNGVVHVIDEVLLPPSLQT